MRVYFDARFIRTDSHDGISRFSSKLLEEIHKKIDLIALIHQRDQIRLLPQGCNYLLVNDPTHLFAELRLPKRLNREGAEIVFSPMQTMGSFGRRYKLVLTLHDLIYYRHPRPPNHLKTHIRFAWRVFHLMYWPQRLLLNRADLVVTVSHTTKRLIEKHRLTKRPVRVVYNAGFDEFPKNQSISRKFPGGQTLIYMGSFMDYKNVELLVDAMNYLPGYRLLLLSRIENSRREELSGRLRGDLGDRLEFFNGVTEVEYRKLLSEAFALVSASKDEGFGIPVVEAIEYGTPVVLSNLEIFHEIAGNASLFFEPNSRESYVDQIRSLSDPNLWAEKSRAALRQAEIFSWEQSASQLLSILSELEE